MLTHFTSDFFMDATNWIVFVLFLSYPSQILHCFSAVKLIPSQRRDYEDRLCHAASQPDKIQRNLGPLLITMTIIKL